MKIHLRPIKKNIMYFVFVFILVMFTDTLWIRYINGNRFYLVIVLGIGTLLIGLNHCTKNDFKKLMCFIVPVILTMFVNLDFNLLIIFKVAIICVCWTVATKAELSKLINCYISFMVFIAVFSLICMAFRQTITAVDFIPTINSGTYGTKALLFTNVKIGTGNLYFLRNQGPFWEPGAYQAYLNLAIIFLFFGNAERKNRNIEILILCITVISTISTTGYMALGIIMLAKIFSKDTSSLRSKFIIVAMFLAIALIAVNNETINYLLFDKMNSASNNNISNATRLYSIMQNTKGILWNPVFGIGPSKYSTLFTESKSILGSISVGVNTTTSLSIWALYGMAYFVFFNGGIIYFAKSLGDKFLPTIFILIALFMIYNSENLNYSLFFNWIVVLGYCKKRGELYEDSNNINSI